MLIPDEINCSCSRNDQDNHDEVYGTKPVGGPARKKRKVAG
jgi:hypothetical protein